MSCTHPRAADQTYTNLNVVGLLLMCFGSRLCAGSASSQYTLPHFRTGSASSEQQKRGKVKGLQTAKQPWEAAGGGGAHREIYSRSNSRKPSDGRHDYDVKKYERDMGRFAPPQPRLLLYPPSDRLGLPRCFSRFAAVVLVARKTSGMDNSEGFFSSALRCRPDATPISFWHPPTNKVS